MSHQIIRNIIVASCHRQLVEDDACGRSKFAKYGEISENRFLLAHVAIKKLCRHLGWTRHVTLYVIRRKLVSHLVSEIVSKAFVKKMKNNR